MRLTSGRDRHDTRRHPVTLQLATIAVGRDDQRLTAGAWPLDDTRVTRNHTTVNGVRLAEWYVNGPIGLEQGFTIQGSGIRDRGLQTGQPGTGTRRAKPDTPIAQDADTLRLTMDMGHHPSLAVDLRAQRPTDGANRTYTITVKCTDGDGASSTAQKVVEVTGVR